MELSAPALDWFAAVPISALGALPRCDLLLKAGVTELRWSGPRAPLPGALASASLATAAPAARSIAGVVPGLSVWALHEDAPWSWTAWGDGVPPLLSGLDALVPGNDYLVVSDVERAWTFPRPTLQPSAFEDAQVVSFYGYPGIAVMGALGAYSPDRAAAELARWADRYDRLNGPRDVIPAFHLIVAVAQRTPQRDGSYLRRLSDEGIAEYVEAARDHSMLLFLDIQIGWSDPLAEVELLEPFLAEPFVHLALDPEFATGRFGERPGTVIGALDARQINAVQDYLAALVVEEGLPPKILVLHQFLQRMVRDRDAIAAVPEVELTIDMDGFGNDRLKLDKYDRFALAAPADRAAIKLFFDWDAPLDQPQHPPGARRPAGPHHLPVARPRSRLRGHAIVYARSWWRVTSGDGSLHRQLFFIGLLTLLLAPLGASAHAASQHSQAGADARPAARRAAHRRHERDRPRRGRLPAAARAALPRRPAHHLPARRLHRLGARRRGQRRRLRLAARPSRLARRLGRRRVPLGRAQHAGLHLAGRALLDPARPLRRHPPTRIRARRLGRRHRPGHRQQRRRRRLQPAFGLGEQTGRRLRRLPLRRARLRQRRLVPALSPEAASPPVSRSSSTA